MHRMLITGVTSLHGWPLFKALTRRLGAQQVLGICPPKTKRSQLDCENAIPCCVNDAEHLQAIFRQFKPTGVIHAAGICDLDVCEQWPSLAFKRNVEGTQNVMKLSRDCYVMALSTDLVFSGNHPPEGGYAETDQPDPISMIGKTFAQAEAIVAALPDALIVRKGLPMGPSISGRKGPMDYLAYRFSRGKPLTLFVDELRSVLYQADLTRGLLRLLEREAKGLYHLGGPHKVSLYAIGEYVIKTRGYDPTCLIRASRHDDTSGLPRIGDVSLNSAIAYQRIGETPRPWPAAA